MKKVNKAMKILENLDRLSGNLHLLGEHADVEKGEFTGNYHQVFVHAQVVSTIRELEKTLS